MKCEDISNIYDNEYQKNHIRLGSGQAHIVALQKISEKYELELKKYKNALEIIATYNGEDPACKICKNMAIKAIQ